MVETITQKNEIYLGGTTFPIEGRVRKSLVSTFPSKVVIGSYTFDDEQIASNWIISDQRGGILVEEMDESIHQDRCWWSTCNLGFKGHIVLPPLATEATMPTTTAVDVTDGGLEIWTNATTLTNWTKALAGGSLDREATEIDAGTYSAKITSTASDAEIYQDLSWSNEYRGRMITVTVRCKGTVGSEAVLEIDDGVTQTTAANAGTSWETLKIEFQVGSAATQFRIVLRSLAGTKIQYFDAVTVTAPVATTIKKFITHDGKLYMVGGNVISELNSAGTAYNFVKNFPTTITDVVSSVGNDLYVFLGDDDEYWYMATTTSSATLNEALDASETGVDVTDGTQFTVGDIITMNSEDMYVGVIAGNTLTVLRGYVGTTAATHTIRATITTRRFTETNVADATLGVHWDNKLFKTDSAGLISHAATPNSATPSWTANGALVNAGLADNSVNSLFVYRDADGNLIIYAGTQVGLFAHDTDNTQWLPTELSLPNHPNAAKGVAWWRDALYVSSGLDVTKYIAARTATIAETGLSSDDELPSEYDGEIVDLVKGYNNMYALVDSSIPSGTNTSSVMAYDGIGWQTRWLAGTNDDTMHHGLISSVVSHRLWFDHNDKVYSIPEERSLRNPSKVSSYTYGASGVHITPWFDANSPYPILALRVTLDCDGMSANETVVVRYRINHATTAVAATWTLLGTITADGETEYTFGAAAIGIVARAIQFRFELARGGTTTLSPDILKVSFAYIDLLPAKWGFSAIVDCTEDYGGLKSSELISNMNTLVEKQTLSEFTYLDESGGTETYYCKVSNALVTEETGRILEGQYQISLVEP